MKLWKATLAVLGIGIAASLATAPARAADAGEVVIATTGGAYGRILDELFFKPFTEETGIKVRQVSSSTAEAWAKIKAMSQVGHVEWDLILGVEADLHTQRDLIQKIDCSQLPHVTEQGMPGACSDYGVISVVGTIGTLAYNKDAFPNGGPRTWADLFDTEKFPGPRGLMDSGTPWDMLAIALLADGVAPDKLYPLDLDRAFAKLDKIKPDVAVWWRSGDQSQQMFRSGEVVAGVLWSGRAFMLKNEGQPLQMVIPGSLRTNGYFIMVKDAPHKSEALKLMDYFMTRPEAHLAFRRRNFNDTMNKAAIDLLSDDERASALTAPENWNAMVQSDYGWIAENRQMITERWKNWIAQ